MEEFNFSQQVVGYPTWFHDAGHASIKCIGFIDENKSYVQFLELEAKVLFPGKDGGFIFEPSFLRNHTFGVGDLISFEVEENPKAEGDDNLFKLKRYGDVERYGNRLRQITGFNRSGYHVDLSLLKIHEDDVQDAGDFYGYTDKYVLGKLRVLSNGAIIPALNNRIKLWDFDTQKLVDYEYGYNLVNEPEGDAHIIDCMSNHQLFEWFREKLKISNPEYVKLLDINSKWRSEFPVLLNGGEPERFEADKERLRRFEDLVQSVNFSITDLKLFTENSPRLSKVFNEAVYKQKEKLKQGYAKDLEKEFAELKNQGNKEIELLKDSKKKLETECKTLREEFEIKSTLIDDLTSKLEIVQKDKGQVLEVFGAIKDLIGSDSVSNINYSKDYQVDTLSRKVINAEMLPTLVKQLKLALNGSGIDPRYAEDYLRLIKTTKGCFVPSLNWVYSLFEAFGNVQFVIQHVGVNWLSFKQLWQGGLEELWTLSMKNPGTFYCLVLDQVNMSSPEVFAAPLLSFLKGERKSIPYAKSVFPENLRLFATKAPSEDPAIGLPLNEISYPKWGAIGFAKGNNLDPIEVDLDEFVGVPFEALSFMEIDDLEWDLETHLKRQRPNLFD